MKTKRNYHLCLSADNEVLFRDLEDYHRGFNVFAASLYKTSSVGLVESFMSTHCHLVVQTSEPDSLMFHFRNSYSKYFNYKYLRSGKLGENKHFSMDVIGHYHMLAAMSYVLRNPLHHGVSPIPFAYPHSTSNWIFKKEMGNFYAEPLLAKRSQYTKFLGRHVEYPDSFRMTQSGVFTRESVLNIPYVESLFTTPRAYCFYMTRKSSEEWEREQGKDSTNEPVINLMNVESGVKMHSPERMLAFENGRENYRAISDMELCAEIDQMVSERYSKKSVYQLSDQKKYRIGEYLHKFRHINEHQIRRCLAM